MSFPAGTIYHDRTGMISRCRVATKVRQSVNRAGATAALDYLRAFLSPVACADAERIIDADGIERTNLALPAGLDETTVILTLMSAVCRASLDFVPCFFITAPHISGSGVGKGFLATLISLIAFGAPPQAFSLSRDRNEQEKRIVSALMEAWPAFVLDNLNAQTFSNDLLASQITMGKSVIRPLGSSTSIEISSRALIFLTGNDLKPGEDLARRSIVIRLDSRRENTEGRRLPRNVLADTLTRRPALLSAILTIWRWGRQNRRQLPTGRALAGFETWLDWCRDPLLALGCPDPLDRMDETKAADTHRTRIAETYRAWWSAHAGASMRASELAEPVIAEIDPQKHGRQFVANQCLKLVGSRVGGFVLEAHRGEGKWSVTKYRLVKTDDAGDALPATVEGVL